MLLAHVAKISCTGSGCLISVELVLFVVPHGRGFGVYLGSEVAKADQRFGLAGVLEGDSSSGAVFRAKIFVLGQLGEANELWTVQGLAIDLAGALDADEAIGALIFDGALHAGLDREFLGGE